MNRNTFSTVMGLAVAICNAWVNIDWKDFSLYNEWPKLAISALIAIGGYATEVKKMSP
ncbi:MAG: hypothetical protein H0X41_01815 [Chitinophagaceae bacterium]|nr:hypothetical protein [Chitinophagaceae bacterium]